MLYYAQWFLYSHCCFSCGSYRQELWQAQAERQKAQEEVDDISRQLNKAQSELEALMRKLMKKDARKDRISNTLQVCYEALIIIYNTDIIVSYSVDDSDFSTF